MEEQISEKFAREILSLVFYGTPEQINAKINIFKEKGYIKKSPLDEARDTRENIHHKIENNKVHVNEYYSVCDKFEEAIEELEEEKE
jgi:hypothetical protein